MFQVSYENAISYSLVFIVNSFESFLDNPNLRTSYISKDPDGSNTLSISLTHFNILAILKNDPGMLFDIFLHELVRPIRRTSHLKLYFKLLNLAHQRNTHKLAS
ncbi:hypothetical protein Scep_022908 [Stephania cephalantha]|uniref:Uncharacterized protein n=1 Tax=Stephania cephalantha TaxID=152367 RepID=A0AAP0I2Z9_9MAGN